jgi:hypothetical protein
MVGCDVRLYSQERLLSGKLGWHRHPAPEQAKVDFKWVDAYIARACARDPDLWVVEIETRDPILPLEGEVDEPIRRRD